MVTLATLMTADVTDVFLPDTDEHAESVTYTASGGSPATITAIVDRIEDVVPLMLDDGAFRHKRARLFCSTTAVATVTAGDRASNGDTFTFDSLTWKIESHHTQNGMHTFDLCSIAAVEHSSQPFRVVRG